jgi:Ankyrin repeats (3 copies)
MDPSFSRIANISALRLSTKRSLDQESEEAAVESIASSQSKRRRKVNHFTTDDDSLASFIRRPSLEDEELNFPLPEAASDPDEYFLRLLNVICPHLKWNVQPAAQLFDYFPTITEAQMARYQMHIVNMVRTNDRVALQQYVSQHGPQALDCCNRFGESLLHMACRRGFTEMVQWLLSLPLTVRVRDDGGRTPLHDACWCPEPPLAICTAILQRDPSLFLIADQRGYTPFQYARQSDGTIWCRFLYEHRFTLLKWLREDWPTSEQQLFQR